MPLLTRPQSHTVVASTGESRAVRAPRYGIHIVGVNVQGSLYFGRCNVNDLHGAVAASSGDGVTTWAETDALDSATEVQGSLYLAR